MPTTLILGQLTLGVQCGQYEQFQTLCKGIRLLLHQIVRLQSAFSFPHPPQHLSPFFPLIPSPWSTLSPSSLPHGHLIRLTSNGWTLQGS